jgi:hypothetical protein
LTPGGIGRVNLCGAWVDEIHRVARSVRIGLIRDADERVDCEELSRAGVVVAIYEVIES